MLFSAQLGWGKTFHYRLFHLPPPLFIGRPSPPTARKRMECVFSFQFKPYRKHYISYKNLIVKFG